MDIADWNGVPFRRLLRRAERLSEAAICRGFDLVKTPCSKSSASLRFMTSADHLRRFFGRIFWVLWAIETFIRIGFPTVYDALQSHQHELDETWLCLLPTDIAYLFIRGARINCARQYRVNIGKLALREPPPACGDIALHLLRRCGSDNH